MPVAVLPARRPVESAEARLARMQAMFKGKVTLRPDGRFEFFYDFSDPAQLDDWIIREANAEWAVEGGWLVCKKMLLERPSLRVVLVGPRPSAKAERFAHFLGASAYVSTASSLNSIARAALGGELPSIN